MKKLAFSILFLGFCTNFAYSQSDFKEAYLINNAGDTIRGYINDPGRLKTLKKCEFKPNLEAKKESFLPDQIKAFRILNGSLYETIEITADSVSEPVFIEKLLEGILDVFYATDQTENYYIIRDSDGKLYDLKNSKIEVVDGNSVYMKKRKEYIYTLRYLLKDDPSIINRVDNLSFETNAILDLTFDYHNDVCDSYSCVIYTNKAEKIEIRPAIFVGYTISHIKLESEYMIRMNQEFLPSSDIFIGSSINFMDPNVSKRFSIQIEIMLQNSKYVKGISSFNMQYLKIPISVIYTYPVKKIKPSMQMGVVYNNWLKHEAEKIIPAHIIGDALQSKTYQYGFIIRAGFTYPLAEHLNILVGCNYEQYAGKPWNDYAVPDGFGGYQWISESVKVKTDFIGFSVGLQF